MTLTSKYSSISKEIEEPSSARTKRYLLVTVRNVCFDYLLKNVPTEDLADYEADSL